MRKAKNEMSRRTFLKGVTGLVSASALAAIPESVKGMVDVLAQQETDVPALEVVPALETKEDNEIVPGSSVVIDFFDTQKIAENVYHRLTGRKLPPFEEACSSWGIEPSELTDLSSYIGFLPAKIFDFPEVVAYAFAASYKGHGEKVMEVRANTAEFLGFNSDIDEVEKRNIPDAFDLKGFDFKSDTANPTFWIYLDPEAISTVITSSTEEVVNVSFQVGKMGVTFNLFEEKNENVLPSNDPVQRLAQLVPHPLAKKDRSLSFWDGHSAELANENVPLLAKIARDNPKKIIIASLGNPTVHGLPDIRAVRERLTADGLWPENLILAGVYGKNEEYDITDLHGYGGDVYVPVNTLVRSFGAQAFSTTATGVVGEIVSETRKMGYSLPEIMNLFKSSSTSRGSGDLGDEYASRIGLRALRSALAMSR